MACIPIPKLPVPTLPSPITFGVAIPPLGFDATLCCKIASFHSPPIPLTLVIPIDPATMTLIRGGIQAIQAYLDALPFKCPRE